MKHGLYFYGSVLVGSARGNDNDPRIFPVDQETVDKLLPFTDQRGCPRWRMRGDGDLELIPVEERVVPLASRYEALKVAEAHAALLKRPELDADPELKAHVEGKQAELEAAVEVVTRAGVADDEPRNKSDATKVTPVGK